jgi:hypothetical protein
MKAFLKTLRIPLALCLLISILYTMPTFQGKIHSQSDVNQGLLSMTEAKTYQEKDGELPYWTNAIFSGMPTTLIVGRPSDNLVARFNQLFFKTLFPFRIMIVNMLGFMVLLLALRIHPWLALAGATAYAFATYSISSVEAAHYTKCLAMGVLPAILGGFIMILNRNYIWGFFTMAFSLSLQIYYFHYQITFYTLLVLLVFGTFYLILNLRNKDVKHLTIGALLAITAGILGVGSNIVKLKNTSEYSKQSMRGGSALAKDNNDNQAQAEEGGDTQVGSKGLNIDYAYSWSYGIGETFTLFIPGFAGRSSNEDLGTGSSLYKELTQKGVDRSQATEFAKQAPMYFGNMPFTSGPVYIGAAVFFLFILGLWTVKDPIKWPILIAIGLSVGIAWGKYFPLLNEFLFYNIPYYNKFRTPMMALTIAQVMIPLLGILGLQRWLTGDFKTQEKQDILKKTGLIAGGLVLLIGVLGSFMRDYSAPGDERMESWLVELLHDARANMVLKDSFRSLLYIGLAFGLLWFWLKGTFKDVAVHYGLLLIMLLDLGTLGWHYLGWDDYKFKYRAEPMVEITGADQQILQDKDKHYRVFELTPNRDPFSDNRGSRFHKLINGYHPAKLSIYQDLILNHLGKYNEKVLDMLNCKYLIGYDKAGNATPQLRETAMGNAWFVQRLEWKADARTEIDALKDGRKPENDSIPSNIANSESGFEPAVYAVAQKQNDNLNNEEILGKQTEFRVDSAADISLYSYHPDTLVYSSNNNHEGLAVFSELYYPGWRAYIDGKEVPHGRVNYALRGLKIPAGEHKVMFVFRPEKGNALGKVELAGSLLIILILPAAILLGRRTRKEEPTA